MQEEISLSKHLNDKIAIVTGAGHGIGQAIALRFGAEGTHVAVNDVDGATAEAVAQTIIAGGGSALAVIADVSDKAQVDRLFDATLERFGTIDILVNNAGLTNTERHFLEADEEWWTRIIASRGMSPEVKKSRGENIPLGRVGEVDEMAGPAVFLASDDARYITGHMLFVDGGLLAQQRSATVDIFPLSKFPKLEVE
ncbi:MAG: SDR family oxidoreductase [Chloroflexi bacterium]|nr:SDR family oxidoreductase [Chloroflexota bacterium]